MQIEAIQLGESINIKKFLDQYKLKSTVKDPVVLEWKLDSHIVLFRYGAVVLWNMSTGEKNDFLLKVAPFINNPMQSPPSEEAHWKLGKQISASNGTIRCSELDLPSIQLISVSLARTVVLDTFEKEVDQLLVNFSGILRQFIDTGHASIRSKRLLQLAGSAMHINNRAVSQMAMLDKPDFTWDDPQLDALFSELEEEYEISDRYSILGKKIETLMHDGEFIMNFLETRRTNNLELIIVILFVVDILLILLEKVW